MIEKDKLVKGPFGSDACYEQVIDNDGQEVTTWLCFGSGFTSSTLMDKDGPAATAARESSPELYRDLEHVDENNRSWFPATITIPHKGMVFADGNNTKNWRWCAVKAIELTKKEQESGKFPSGQTVKMDMQNKTYFERKDFMDALEAIDFYKLD